MKLTEEFSICLICDDEAAEKISVVRRLLPPSPHRDDRPHLTLLRGLRTSGEISDADLSARLSDLVDYKPLLRQKVSTWRPMEWQGFFGWTTVIPVRTSPELRRRRKQLMQRLLRTELRIVIQDKYIFLPHITVRLGVYADRRRRAEIRRVIPPGAELGFSHVVIFRTLAEGRRRFIREVPIL